METRQFLPDAITFMVAVICQDLHDLSTNYLRNFAPEEPHFLSKSEALAQQQNAQRTVRKTALQLVELRPPRHVHKSTLKFVQVILKLRGTVTTTQHVTNCSATCGIGTPTPCTKVLLQVCQRTCSCISATSSSGNIASAAGPLQHRFPTFPRSSSIHSTCTST